MEHIIATVLMGTLGIIALGAGLSSLRSSNVARSRIERMTARGVDIVRTPEEESRRLRVRDQVARVLEPFAMVRDTDSSAYAKLRQRLIHAGFRSAGALPVYMGARVVCSAVLAFASVPFALLLDDSMLAVLASIAAGGVGFIFPGYVVDRTKLARRRSISNALPDAIDMMVVCVEAGLSLAAAIHRVASEFARSSPVMAAELRLTVLQTQAGKSLSDAMRALALRNNVPELTSLTSALIQTERLGTRIAHTLRVQSESIRTRRLQLAEEVAQRAPVKMLFPAGFFIFMPTLAIMVAPAIERLGDLFQ
jgi:tight adherence protein C